MSKETDVAYILSSDCKMRSIKQPFEILQFKNVFVPEFADVLKDEILQLDFDTTCSDLFSFKQTRNLLNIEASPAITAFTQALLTNIFDMLSGYFKITFNEKVTLSSSLYTKGDFLLCHDDASDDRAVAFIYYLTEESWNKSWGGSLDLFEKLNGKTSPHIKKSIFPKFNSLICFKVDPDVTYHQVSEVTKKVHRLSINGWFHSNKCRHEPKILPETKTPLPKQLKFNSIGAQSFLTEFINHRFFDKVVMKQFRKEFCDSSLIAASDFLRKCTLDVITKELEFNTVWNIQDPPFKKRYDVAAISTLPTCARTFVQFLISLEWFNYLESVLGFSKNNVQNLSLEIQRWLPGYYTLLYYSNVQEVKDVIDVFLFIDVSGYLVDNLIVYSDATSTECSVGDESIQLPLRHNHIFIVRRKSTQSWFIKYLNKRTKCKFYIFQMTFSLGPEESYSQNGHSLL